MTPAAAPEARPTLRRGVLAARPSGVLPGTERSTPEPGRCVRPLTQEPLGTLAQGTNGAPAG